MATMAAASNPNRASVGRLTRSTPGDVVSSWGSSSAGSECRAIWTGQRTWKVIMGRTSMLHCLSANPSNGAHRAFRAPRRSTAWRPEKSYRLTASLTFSPACLRSPAARSAFPLASRVLSLLAFPAASLTRPFTSCALFLALSVVDIGLLFCGCLFSYPFVATAIGKGMTLQRAAGRGKDRV